MNETVRETKRADELKPGDWIAAGPYNGRIDGTDDAEVLFTYRYGSGGGTTVAVTIQEVTIPRPELLDLHADAEITLLTSEEVAGYKLDIERAQKIADIRALADVLERERRIPMPNLDGLQAWIAEGGTPEQALAELREITSRMGLELRQGDKMSDAEIQVGSSVTLQLVAWHPNGRPAEPAPQTADPTGLLHSRADDEPDDPTPVSGARVPPHTGGMTNEGLVDETGRP